MRELLNDVTDRALRYLDGLDSRPVAPTEADIARLTQLGGPLPDGPTDPRIVLAALDEIGSPAMVATTGRRYFGFVIGGSLPAALAANLRAGVWDQNGAHRATSPTAAVVEEVATRWLTDLLGLPTSAGAGFTTGATMANLAALAAAGTPCCRRRAGASRRTVCSAPRRFGSLSVTRCTPAS